MTRLPLSGPISRNSAGWLLPGCPSPGRRGAVPLPDARADVDHEYTECQAREQGSDGPHADDRREDAEIDVEHQDELIRQTTRSSRSGFGGTLEWLSPDSDVPS